MIDKESTAHTMRANLNAAFEKYYTGEKDGPEVLATSDPNMMKRRSDSTLTSKFSILIKAFGRNNDTE